MARWGESCYARAHGGCRGRVQAAHWISVQILKGRQDQARIYRRRYEMTNGAILPPSDEAEWLLDMPLDGLIADPRNGIPLCDHHHASFDRRNGQALDLDPHTEVREFAEEFGLEDRL